MDSIVSAALEEICAEGPTGIALTKLWMMLQPCAASSGLDFCDGVKRAVWNRVLHLQGLRFEARGKTLLPSDRSIRSVQDSERVGVKIVAEERMRDSFLGLHEQIAGGREIPQLKRRIIERVAFARTDGVTQHQLAKEFKMKGNEIFYHLRGLEYNRLIVRRSAVVKTGGKNEKAMSVLHTNFIYLYRYGGNLNSNLLQRIEVTTENTSEHFGDLEKDVFPGESTGKVDVCVKDFLPALEAVCNKLEEANGKVLIVSDIKKALGYRQPKGHKEWRNIVNRLKEANLVEEFVVNVSSNMKKRRKNAENSSLCLRLLKRFDPKDFQPKAVYCGYDDISTELFDKKGQTNEQVVELPIEHQIYDMVDAEGSKGITMSEVCSRLGLDYKRYYRQFADMCSRFGMPIQAEYLNRTKIYRVWTNRNFRHGVEFPDSSKHQISCDPLTSTVPTDSGSKGLSHEKVDNEQIALGLPDNIVNHFEDNREKNDGKVDEAPELAESRDPLSLPNNLPKSREKNDGKADEAPKLAESCDPLSLSNNLPKSRNSRRYPCLDPTKITAQRKQRIISRLKIERFILLAELQKWLQILETEKQTKMDKKTVLRLLEALQKDGQCRCVQVYFPSLGNHCIERTKTVIMHPSVTSVSDIVEQIYKRAKDFDAECRAQALSCSKSTDMHVDSLKDIEKPSNETIHRSEKTEAIRSNGYVPAKMVRTKLLHKFFWSYLHCSSVWEDLVTGRCDDSEKPCSTLKLFALDEAVKAMPIELFLQVVGFSGRKYDWVEYCQRGLSLLSDLSVEEYRSLLDTNATSRLSSVIDMLLRLKLLQLVTTESATRITVVPNTQLSYSMNFKPYIEVPRDRPPSSCDSFDHRPRIRHDFILSSKESVDAYWQTLEYCYAAADPTVASHAFPGSVVPEVFASRQWSSTRAMTTEECVELYERVGNSDPTKKISLNDCVNTAKDLNLTLEQVLRASYNKGRDFQKFSCNFKSKLEDFVQHKSEISDKKRKRSPKHNSQTYIHSRKSDISRVLSGLDFNEEIMQEWARCLNDDSSLIPSNDTLELEDDRNESENCTLVSQCAFSELKPKRRRTFLWNDESDRQLIIQYARYRVTRGSSFFRVDWNSIPDLPAHPTACKNRMAALNKIESVRKAVMMLCNVLGNRYRMHIGRNSEPGVQKLSTFSQIPGEELMDDGITKISFASHQTVSDLEIQKQKWDNFIDDEIKIALDNVLYCKKIYMSEISMKNNHRSKHKSISGPLSDPVDLDIQSSVHNEKQNHIFSSHSVVGNPNHDDKEHNDSSMVSPSSQGGSCFHHFTGRKVDMWSGMGIFIIKLVKESLSISSAVELLKLIFLSSSAASELQTLLAETLRQYSENDLYAAFSYLRAKNFMIRGHGSRPFVLSPKFLHDASLSPFPVDSGKRAARFSSWLCKQAQSLGMDNDFTADFQSGETMLLFALVSLGEVTISMCLPEVGIGEIDELNSSKQDILSSRENHKKQDFLSKRDSDFCLRREKGFPGIKVVLDHMTFPGPESTNTIMEENCLSFPVGKNESGLQKSQANDTECSSPSIIETYPPCILDFHCNFSCKSGSEVLQSDSLWKDMTNYTELFSSKFLIGTKILPSSDVIRSVYIVVKQAGEQGLAMGEISQSMVMQDNQIIEVIVDTLEVFQLVLKVNAFDCVRVVDSRYKSKYFITLFAKNTKDMHPFSQKGTRESCKTSQLTKNQAVCSDPKNGADVSLCDGHKLTILSVSQEPEQTSMTVNSQDNGPQINISPSEGDLHIYRPILPWINGDGSTDTIMYKGLVRRVLGTVLQNPGILEDDLITEMDMLNPQSCRQLLELMILDKQIVARKMFQTSSCMPPILLQGLIKNIVRKPEPLFRKHLFANPRSVQFL